jgi:hypothetical protein
VRQIEEHQPENQLVVRLYRRRVELDEKKRTEGEHHPDRSQNAFGYDEPATVAREGQRVPEPAFGS